MLTFKEKISAKMLRTLIIDDESPVRSTLRGLLTKTCPQVKIVGEASSVKSGLTAIREHSPDLILLDIKMDDGTGFDLLNQFDHSNFKIVFITAYEEYAIRAFEFSAVDYILKPVNPEKLVIAVNRAAQIKSKDFNIQLNALKDNIQNADGLAKKIILKSMESIFLFNIDDIVHCGSDGSYTVFETVGNQKIVISKLLKEYDTLLSGSGFFRIHRSHLINLRHITRFDKQDGGFVIMSNGSKLPVSASGRERLLELFEELGNK
jgi:two-component system, LytTR family, response regulator